LVVGYSYLNYAQTNSTNIGARDVGDVGGLVVWFQRVGVALESTNDAAALLLAAVLALAIWKHCRDELPFVPTDAFGRAQLLFLSLLWLAVVGDFVRVIPVLKSAGVLYVHVTFWLTALGCTTRVVLLRRAALPIEDAVASNDAAWRLSWKYAACWLRVPLLLLALAKGTLALHAEPLPGSHLRFAALPQ
jgi:hypothetical protein